MSASSLPPPPVFKGENYDFWAARMESFFMAHGLWHLIEDGYDSSSLPDDPTVQQIKDHNELWQKNYKALIFLHSAIHEIIFPRIVAIKSAKAAWCKLQEEFQGSERVRQQRLLTLKREFEMLKMKDAETLYGEVISDYKVVKKVLISLPDRFEAKVSVIEESCDLTKLSITELCSKLQAQEMRFSRKSEEVTEGAFQIKHKGKQGSSSKESKKKFSDKSRKGKSPENSSTGDQTKKSQGKFPPCPHCNKTNHPEKTCWQKYGRPQCKICKKLGHIEKYCRLKQNPGQSASTGSQEAHYSSNP
ncbi:uncharacterized protein LOC120002538 [Tripterygium wilfordii]|uniref:uncharacterized protein LOC120002538 n=1 Tax=Tripterygium wilfordii TaxID=458696 RepID=UPI0018F81B5E|nr:uncharacterized protein LOC120002538 [Tripterygium wilfordii]